MENDKISVTNVGPVDSASDCGRDVRLGHVDSANEQIVQHLHTTGEEVGMTFRTFMAATVRSFEPCALLPS